MFDKLNNIKKPINSVLKAFGLYTIMQHAVVYIFSKRNKLSKRYIKGSGLEIGALHTPLKVFNNAQVTYVDRMDVKGLRKHYPELRNYTFMPVGVVDDGESLQTVADNSQDFIIANHFIEHCENPLLVLKNHLRVLKKGGIIYMAVPDKSYTFDKPRSLTSNDHLLKDFINGPGYSRTKHYEEWAALMYPAKSRDAQKKKANELKKSRYSIHFHVWDKNSFYNFLQFAKKHNNLKFTIEEVTQNINEFIVIIKK